MLSVATYATRWWTRSLLKHSLMNSKRSLTRLSRKVCLLTISFKLRVLLTSYLLLGKISKMFSGIKLKNFCWKV
ncbi:hypothetical protein LINPERHAP1_LOCUS13093 [Linum perenne]